MSVRAPVDLFKRYRNEYVAPKTPRLIQVEPSQYLTIAADDSLELCYEVDAEIAALYAVVSALRSVVVAVHQRDFMLGKTERLLEPATSDAETQCWKEMMRVPDFVTQGDLACALESLRDKFGNGAKLAWVRHVRLEQLSEGLCVQVLQLGPENAAAEAKSWLTLRDFAQSQGLEWVGPPHVIYLASPRHVPPEHLRILLRSPVRALNALDFSLSK